MGKGRWDGLDWMERGRMGGVGILLLRSLVAVAKMACGMLLATERRRVGCEKYLHAANPTPSACRAVS